MRGKKILHISHHYGCFRDQDYVLHTLGLEVTNYKFTENLYQITKEVSDSFWYQNKEILNSFDYILTSDTAGLSRIFLEHIDELKPKLVIWICNRFDVVMNDEPVFYELFKQHINHPNVRVVPYTFFEKMWCLMKGIDISFTEVITPIGKELPNPNSDGWYNLPNSQWYNETYGASNPHDAELLVTGYRNDHFFMPLGNTLRNLGVSVYDGTFPHISAVKRYKGMCTLPDAFSKFLTFETIQHNIPVILPSKAFLHHLCHQPDYLFNVTGYGGAELMTEDLIALCEWYKPEFNSCRFYFNAFEEIPEIVKSINKDTVDYSAIGLQHENEMLTKWLKVYDSF